MKPILFQTRMVQAIQDGWKTMTRRAVKNGTAQSAIEKAPPYSPGDILYVRETWVKYDGKYYYKADGIPRGADGLPYPHYGWKPSIHMPKEAARLFLRVTDVHMERLQDITEADCINDGYFHPVAVQAVGKDTLFKALWDDTIKKADLPLYGWDANPLVWVITFKKINKAEGR